MKWLALTVSVGLLCVVAMMALDTEVFGHRHTPDTLYRCPVCLAQTDDTGIITDPRCPVVNTLPVYRCPRGHTWVMLPEEK